MSWKDILKAPYTIVGSRGKSVWDYDKGERVGVEYSASYDNLYQGFQGEKDTTFWTAEVQEAMAYAFFGSNNTLRHPYDLKNIDKPQIRVSKTTPENVELFSDDDHYRQNFESPAIRPPPFDMTALPIERVGRGSLKHYIMSDSDFVKLAKEFLQKLENNDNEIWKHVAHAISIGSDSTYNKDGVSSTERRDWKPELVKHIKRMLFMYYGVKL